MIRVCVVDDQTLVRQGIRSLLELAEGVVVSAEAGDGDEALDAIVGDPPDVVLLDCACRAATASRPSRRCASGSSTSRCSC